MFWFIHSSGVGLVNPISTVYIIENYSINSRGPALNYACLGWPLSRITVLLVAMYIMKDPINGNWIILVIYSTCCVMFAFILVFIWMDESIRYLFVND